MVKSDGYIHPSIHPRICASGSRHVTIGYTQHVATMQDANANAAATDHLSAEIQGQQVSSNPCSQMHVHASHPSPRHWRQSMPLLAGIEPFSPCIGVAFPHKCTEMYRNVS